MGIQLPARKTLLRIRGSELSVEAPGLRGLSGRTEGGRNDSVNPPRAQRAGEHPLGFGMVVPSSSCSRGMRQVLGIPAPTLHGGFFQCLTI